MDKEKAAPITRTIRAWYERMKHTPETAAAALSKRRRCTAAQVEDLVIGGIVPSSDTLADWAPIINGDLARLDGKSPDQVEELLQQIGERIAAARRKPDSFGAILEEFKRGDL